jgi:hypothetical protein
MLAVRARLSERLLKISTGLRKIIGNMGWLMVVVRTGMGLFVGVWRVTRSRAAGLIKKNWPVIFSSMAIMIYMRRTRLVFYICKMRSFIPQKVWS